MSEQDETRGAAGLAAGDETLAPAHVIDVHTPSRSYQVHVGQGVIDQVGDLTRAACGGTRAAVVSDSNVAPLYANAVAEALVEAGYEASIQVFPAGEDHKRLATLEPIIEGLAEANLTRDDVVVAVGGGVTGDMAGLAAALYLRGCQVVQVPTSLLAMVDSSVGGKTAVDLEHGKNLCGAFWQPSLVVADVDCLDTLTPNLLADSCGEVIKHAVLADPALFDQLGERPLTSCADDGAWMAQVVARNVEIKRDVVDADERERGARQTLNLGHTIGHAVEAASNFALGHGSCVAVGLCCMARASATEGWCEPSLPGRIEALCQAHGLPTDTDLPHDQVVAYAAHDKKRHADSVNVVIPEAVGRVSVRRVSLDDFARLVDEGCGVTS